MNNLPDIGDQRVKLVSLIVTVLLVATMVPLTLPVLNDTVNVSAPSVVISAVGVTVNDPALEVIVNEPEVTEPEKSAAAVVELLTDQ